MKSISYEIFKSAKWSVISDLASYSSLFLKTIVLARYLSPSDFGLSAIAFSAVAFFTLFSQFGLNTAIIGNKKYNRYLVDSIFNFSMLISCIFFIIFILLIPFILSFYENLELKNILILVGIGMIISTSEAVPVSILQKKLCYKKLAIVKFSKSILILFITILLCVLDFGIYAIIIPNLVAGFIVIFLAMYFSSYFPRIYFRFNHIKRSTNFGASTLICNVFNYISNNIVNFTMVKIWGTNILGEYILAYNSTQMGYSALITPLHNSLFPILKNISNKKDLLRESINKLTHFQGIFIAPLIILSIYAMPDIIPIIYGEKWKFLIPIIQIMLVTSVFQCLMPPSNNILFAIGLPEISAKFSILRAIMYIAAISVAIINKFDVIFVTILLASINILIILLLAFATLIEINYSPFKFLIFIKKALLLSLSISLILYASDVYAKKILFNQNNFIVLCIGILYITTYLSIFCKEEIKQVSGKLKSLGFLKSEI